MPDENAWRAAVRLTIAMEAAAALAARIRVDNEGLEVDPEIRRLLDAIAAELADDADHIDAAGPAIVGMVRAFIRQSAELIENPGRIGEWDEVDETILQGVGRLSMGIIDAFKAAAASLPGLGDRLAQEGTRFLDVGTGTGWLAIATARAFPAVHVTGIDIFEPALQLARGNVATEAMTDRVDIRVKDAVHLDSSEVYDAIWLPLPFMSKEIVPQAIAAAVTALRPGGWLLPGTFAGPGDRLSNLLVDLRTVRSGGHPWKSGEMIELMGAHGLLDAHEVHRSWSAPVRLYGGRRS